MSFNNYIKDKDIKLKNILIKYKKNTKKNLKFNKGVIILNNKDYSKNFGIQWNEFDLTQYDSHTNLKSTEKRLKLCSEWDLKKLKNKLILEIGSGAGRFTEIFLKYKAKIITIDMSDAIYVNQKYNNNKNIIFIKGDFKSLIKMSNSFDYVFCYGVAQHTQDPKLVYKLCVNFAKKEGFVSIDHYRKMLIPNPFYHPKYIWRIFVKNMKPKKLLNFVKFYIPIYIKFDTLIIKIFKKKLSTLIRGCIPIPCFNYFGNKNVNQDKNTLLEWAIMDTYDALGAKYDYPFSIKQVEKIVKPLGLKKYKIKKGGNGIVFNGIK